MRRASVLSGLRGAILVAGKCCGIRSEDTSPAGFKLRKGDHSGERGQVLILVGVAGVVLMGFLALAVDVGNLYFARRAAQNAADSAALVGAQNAQGMVPNVTLVAADAVRDARRYAIKNGFLTDSGANNGSWNQEVRVDVPPATGPNAGQPDYVEVRILRQLNSLFAGVLGVNLQVSARAVARAKHLALEVATLSLDPGDASTVVNGSANVNVVGSTYSRGTTKNQSGTLNITRRAYSNGGFVGGINAAEGTVSNPPDLFDPLWDAPTANPGPGVSWNSNGAVERSTMDADGWVWIDPGTYDWISIRSGDKVKFRPGVYRTTRSQGVTINGGAVSTGPVCFVVDGGGGFDAQAQGNVNLFSGPAYNNILIWTQSTGNAVKIAGGNDVSFWGTIYAPQGTARIAGSATGTVHGQVVAQNIILEGSAGVAVVYDPNRSGEIPGPALVE